MGDAAFLREVRRLSDDQLLAIARRATRPTLRRLYEACCIHDSCNCMTKGVGCSQCRRLVYGPRCQDCDVPVVCHHQSLQPLRPVPAEIEATILARLFPSRRGHAGYAERRPPSKPLPTYSQRSIADGMRDRLAHRQGLQSTSDLVQTINGMSKEAKWRFIVNWHARRNGRLMADGLTAEE